MTASNESTGFSPDEKEGLFLLATRHGKLGDR